VDGTDWQMVAVGDFNGDTRPDLLWRSQSTGVNFVWYMNGPNTMATAVLPTVPIGPGWNWIVVGAADFNGDGFADLLWRDTTSGDNAIWYLKGSTMIGGKALPTVPGKNWVIKR